MSSEMKVRIWLCVAYAGIVAALGAWSATGHGWLWSLLLAPMVCLHIVAFYLDAPEVSRDPE